MNGAVPLPLEAPEITIPAAGTVIRRSVLRSGVRVLTESVPGARSATIGLWIPVGSRDEDAFADPRGERVSRFGSTHFLEHLLFKGTRERSALDIAVSFDQVGGEHNAVTGKEHTCYYAKVRDRDLTMAVDVLADMVTSSLLARSEFETERGVILEELAMAGDDPADVAGERLFEAVLGAHPLARPIGGTPDAISSVTRDAVWDHYRRNYRPRDLVVTVAGAVDHDALVVAVTDALRGYGWDLDEESAPRARRDTVTSALEPGAQRVDVQRPNEQTAVMIGTRGLVATDPRRYVLALTNAVLGGGMSSRLFQEIRERRGLAYSVYSFASSYSDAGLFGMSAGCAPARAEDVTALMLAELDRLARDGVDDAELDRARGQLNGSAALALEDSDTRMSRLGRAEIVAGEFSDLDENQRRLDAVTTHDVQELARELAELRSAIVHVGSADPRGATP